MGCESAITVIFGDSVHIGGITRLNRISFCSFLWCNAPAIVDAIKSDVISDNISSTQIQSNCYIRQTLFLTSGIATGEVLLAYTTRRRVWYRMKSVGKFWDGDGKLSMIF